MAEWLVKLDGHEADLLELSRQLTGSELNVRKDEGDYWLRSAQFRLLTDAGEVRTLAAKLLLAINGAGRLFNGGFQPVRQAGVQQRQEDGSRQTFAFGEANLVLGQVTAHGVGVAVGGTPSPVPPPISDLTFATLHASQDDAVERVLRIYGSRDHDWVNLYRAFEIVQADVGNIPAIGWATKSEIARFKHTANSVGAVGDDARHGAEPTQPPKNPMNLEDARGFIRHLLQTWLASKRPTP